MFGREKVAMIFAEFLGTFMLASVILSMINVRLFPLFVGLAASIAFVGARLAFGSATGGYYNPALVIADWTARKLETAKAFVFIATQMFAGVVAWTLNEYLLGSPLTNIANEEFAWTVFIAEALGAFVFAIVFTAATQPRRFDKFTSDITAGTGLVLGMLIASMASNGLINPAVALGVQSFSFTYVAAAILGAVLGVNLYSYFFGNSNTAKKAVSTSTTVRKKTVKRKVTRRK